MGTTIREAFVANVVSSFRKHAVRCAILLLLLAAASVAHAQVTFPLGSKGNMGLGSPNGDFYVVQDDLQVKVPGGYVRVNRDFDGNQWVFNRQWSGLGRPRYYKASYASMGSYFSCTIIDGISSCDKTASSGTVLIAPDPVDLKVQQTRVPSDPYFGRDGEGTPLPDLSTIDSIARKGVGFTRSSDGSSFVSSKHPRFVVRPLPVPTLPTSTSPDAHPASGKPGQGGVATTEVNGFRWIDRSGAWIEYDNFGRITSYGDRNDVRVWFQYGSHGQIERVLDDNGRTVFTFLYSPDGEFITEARDHTPFDGSTRRVQYQYDDTGRLRAVVDARGNTTKFDYGHAGDSSDIGSIEPGFGTASTVPVGTGSTMLISNTTLKIKKVTDAEGRVTQIGYGVTGRMQKLVTPDGGVHEIEYGYDKLKKEFSVTLKSPETENGRKIETRRFNQEGQGIYREVNGRVLMTAEGSSHSLTYIDANNNRTTITRDNFDEVSKITYADGASLTYSYEAGSTDVREIVDEVGSIHRYFYDDRGNLSRRVAAQGLAEEQVTEYQYNGRGEAEVILRKGGTNPDGSVDVDVELRLSYDANGNVSELLDGEGKRWRYEYDSQGNRTKTIDPLGYEWTYTYDSHGNLLSETDPNRNVWSYTYDKTDRILTIKDGRGKISHVGYDSAGRETEWTDPYGAAFTDGYDPAGQLVSRSDALGQDAKLSYDSSGRVRKVVDGEDFATLLSYEEVDGIDRGSNRVARVAYPTFERLYRYDNRRRPTQQLEKLGDDTRLTGITRDARGRITTVTDPNGHTRSYEYDAFGRMTASIDQLGNTVRFGYDHRNNLVSVTNEKGKVSRLSYDKRNLLVTETNPLGESTNYAYDDAGYQVELKRPNGFTVSYDYDPAGRLQTRQSYRPDGSVELTDRFTWGDSDNLVTWTSDRASGSVEYDDADRLLREAVNIDGVTLARAYTYHPNGQVKTYTGPDGITLTYAYDGNGQLDRVDIPGEGSISVTERKWMAPTKVVLPGGTVQEMERDGLLNLTRLRVRTPDQTLAFELENRFGKLVELTERATDGETTRFEYDEAVRLVKADAGFMAGTSETFVIDTAGNRTEHSVVSGTWVYDDANRLQQRGDIGYEYDAAGNLIRQVDASRAEPLRTTHFIYDGYNRLTEVRDGTNQVIARYAYDPFGYRLIKDVQTAGAARGGTVGKTLFLQGEEGLLAEVTSDGSVLRSYGWHPEQSYATGPLFQHADGTYFYYHTDHLGTPWRMTNTAGQVVWKATDYTAFGKADVAATAAIVQPWRFAGQYMDSETGLHYNLQRYYDADSGRYISEDPLGFDSDINFYSYARHSPTNLIDPTGEILPFLIPLAGNYLRCVGICTLIDSAAQALTNPCEIDFAGVITDCLKECVLSMLPLPTPCSRNKLGKIVGVAGGLTGFNSFTGDTEVATPDGLKRIENLRPGDLVLAYDEWAQDTKIEQVTDLALSHREQTIITLTLGTGKQLEVTGGHLLHTPSGWRVAQLLQAGGQLDIKGADGQLNSVSIASVTSRKSITPVYNLEVSNSHTFYVGEDGVLAHNGWKCTKTLPRSELRRPNKRGNAAIGPDGKPVELHHVSKDEVHEMTRKAHREGDNYRKNHPGDHIRPDRNEHRRGKREHWRNVWDGEGW